MHRRSARWIGPWVFHLAQDVEILAVHLLHDDRHFRSVNELPQFERDDEAKIIRGCIAHGWPARVSSHEFLLTFSLFGGMPTSLIL